MPISSGWLLAVLRKEYRVFRNKYVDGVRTPHYELLRRAQIMAALIQS